MSIETRQLQATELRADKESRKLTGIVITYRQIAELGYFKEQFEPGAFNRYLGTAGATTRALFEHDHRQLLGSTPNKTLKLIDSSEALRFELDVVDTSYGDDVLQLVRSGEIRGMSFGFRVIEDKQRIERNDAGVLRTVLEAELPEITVTSIPAYKDATSVSARSIDQAVIDAAMALVNIEERPDFNKRVAVMRRSIANNWT